MNIPTCQHVYPSGERCDRPCQLENEEPVQYGYGRWLGPFFDTFCSVHAMQRDTHKVEIIDHQ